VVLIILALALLLIDHSTTYFQPVRSTLISLTAPIQYLVSEPISFMEWLGKGLTSKEALLKENETLRAQQLLLEAQVQKLTALEQENEKLRGLVNNDITHQDKFLIAQLLAVNTGSLNQQVVLNKGKSDNVYVGQPVLDAYGLMGQVILTGINTSMVLLITDPKSAIPVQINRNGLRAIATGSNDGNNLELIQVAETADIKTGDLLVTSGLGSRFPEGYPVGTISQINRLPGGKFLKIIMLPTAHINQNREVLLIWPKKNELKD
jgi:rod shape-determining protein MreC